MNIEHSISTRKFQLTIVYFCNGAFAELVTRLLAVVSLLARLLDRTFLKLSRKRRHKGWSAKAMASQHSRLPAFMLSPFHPHRSVSSGRDELKGQYHTGTRRTNVVEKGTRNLESKMLVQNVELNRDPREDPKKVLEIFD
jgi:hypothetical protein